MKTNIKDTAILAIPTTAAVWLISYVFAFFKLGTVTNLFSVQIPATSVVTPTIGNKFFSLISGYVPFGLPELAMVYISAFVLLFVGMFLINKWNFPAFKGMFGFGREAGKIFTALLYAGVLSFVVFGWLGNSLMFPGLNTVFGVLIHTLLVGFLVAFVAKFLKL